LSLRVDATKAPADGIPAALATTGFRHIPFLERLRQGYIGAYREERVKKPLRQLPNRHLIKSVRAD
jgi:hypothetical protein